MELEKLKSRWDNFHVSCVVFYVVYGFLCVFAYKPYSRYIYFKDRWDDWHDQDNILEYYAFGAGECCLVMGALATFCYKSLDPSVTVNYDLYKITERYTLFQVACWVMWLCTEAYYTWNGTEWPVIGCLHVFLCSIVLYQSLLVYTSLDKWLQLKNA